MALHELPRFRRASELLTTTELGQALLPHLADLATTPWTYCGYTPLPDLESARPSLDVTMTVDNQTVLTQACGFERQRLVVTAGLRASRFAAVLCWEVLHALAPGGLWIDVDLDSRCHGTALTPLDHPARDYARLCLTEASARVEGQVRTTVWRKHAVSPLAAHAGDQGWTFGILTAGDSPRAAQMARALLALDLPAVEVIFCGPRPSGVPADPCVRAIDLAAPEARGWISRKKNLLAAAARHERLCLLHDRYVVTPDWARALRALGPSLSVATFPQVWLADVDGRFPQRYADYQVLRQDQALAEARSGRLYAGERVFYAPYDDFAETAFVCGGLYATTRTVWSLVRQDETLYHCEWEDVSFGLDCQRAGIPHRISLAMTVESVTPHPMALTRIHDLVAPDVPVPGRFHVSAAQERAACREPWRFKPVFGSSRHAYYARVLTRLNQVPGLDAPLGSGAVATCTGLADFWRVIDGFVRRQTLATRDAKAGVLHFLSDTIYNWPNGELLRWLVANERAEATAALPQGNRLVGWGTGARFRTLHRGVCAAVDRPLDFVVDNDPTRWGATAEGCAVRPPETLASLDPATTVIVVFSTWFDEIRDAARRFGSFRVVAAEAFATPRPFHPLTDMVAHFEEVERCYPVTFHADTHEAAA